jgi:hypothetical protein
LGGYAGIMNPALFIQGKPGQAQQNDRYRAKLFGKRMVFSSETEANVHLNTTEINSITGDDMLSAKKLYKDDIDFLPTHKLQLATNHNPIVTDTTEATWRRLVLIQWTYTVPAGKETGGLSNRIIREEGAGILRRLVLACLRWQREGLTLPKAILESTETYRMEEDRLGRFTAACLTVGVDKEIGADELYTAYAMWAEGSGMKPTSDQKFWKLYRKRPGITKGQNANGQMVYKGVSKKVVANDSSCGQEKLLRGRDTDLTSDEIDRLLHETKANPQLQSHSTEASEATGKVLKGVMKNDDRRSGRTLKENLPTPSVASGDSKESQDSNTVTIGASPLMTLVTATGQAFEVCNRAGWLFVRLELDDGSEAVDARNLQSPNLNAVCELYGVTLPEPSDEYHPVTGTRRVLVEARPDETFGVRVVSVARLAA